MKNIINKEWREKFEKIEEFFELYLIKKAPTLPEGIKKFIVAVWPYLLLIGLIFTLPLVLTAIGLRFILPSAWVLGTAYRFDFFWLFTIATFVLETIALPSLFRRKIGGWKLAYYARLINALGLFLSLDILGLIIGTVISLYFLFQIREFYK